MTLLDARMHGRLADLIFFPPTIHPDLRAMLNPESLRKRKRMEDAANGTNGTPKRARIAMDDIPTALDEGGFGDGGFGDGGFGDGGFGDSFAEDRPPSPHRTPSPSLVDETSFPTDEEDEPPTALTGSLSHSTIATAQLLQSELVSPAATASLASLTKKGVPGGAAGGVRRDDAVRMFFEVLVLASRDVVKVRQERGFGEIQVSGKEGLWGGKFGAVQAV